MKKLTLFVSFYLFIVTNSFASTRDASTALTDLLNQIHSMKANFTQTSLNSGKHKKMNSVGKMALQRPGLFRWDVKKPMPQLIITNKKTMWIYDPDLRQVTVQSFHYNKGEAPALLLSEDNSALSANFSISMTEKSNLTIFSLKPKKSDNMYKEIQVFFNQNKIEGMALKDHLGNYTKINFQQVVLNTPLTLDLFKFKAPKGVDVIDERKK